VTEAQTVFLVDDDGPMRESMALLLQQAGLRVRSFPSAHDFLNAYAATEPGCLVLDLRMPGMTGLELQETLQGMGARLPIIFLSGFGDIPTTVRAIKGGAVDFLEKPVAAEALVARVRHALAEERRQRALRAEEQTIRQTYACLSPREREVMALATRGLANKEIARLLEISPRTVENHRARVMEKMQAENIADLCRMAAVCLAAEERADI
jgi:RNA polymerase sigma factor (sigma-70 family)